MSGSRWVVQYHGDRVWLSDAVSARGLQGCSLDKKVLKGSEVGGEQRPLSAKEGLLTAGAWLGASRRAPASQKT